MIQRRRFLFVVAAVVCLFGVQPAAQAQKQKKPAVVLPFPPKLLDGKEVATETSPEFLKRPTGSLKDDVVIAKTPPTIDFLYYPGQDYPGNPWSVWGDGCATDGKYYSAIGDHLAPKGTALVCEYDAATKKFRILANVSKFLESAGALPGDMNYAPAKVHGRVDLGNDGWLYYSTHRGSPGTTTDKNGYKGDWIFRTHPQSGKTEIVAAHPVPKHCIPCSVLDPERLIFYGGTAAGKDATDKGVQFFAYDIKAKKVLYAGPDGPARYMFFAKSTGRLYYTPGGEGYAAPLMRYDPAKGGPPEKVGGEIGLRAATQETPQGFVYTASKDADATLWSFNTKTEAIEKLGPAAIGKQAYIATLDADPTGRYLYYTAGAHGGSETEGTAVVQYNVQSKQKKVIAFLHPFCKDKYGCTLKGTFGSAIDAKGDKLYVTWNNSRGSGAWDSCVLTVIHIPASERP